MISKRFDIAHIDLIETKIKYLDINQLKSEVYPFDEDEAKTYIKDGRIIFACGIKMIRPGVGHCWVIPSIYIDDYAKSFYKEIKQLLFDYTITMNIHRMQTTVTDAFVKWIELLEFKRESILKQIAHDKSDEFMYVKFY